MGRVINLDGSAFQREGSVRPQHVDVAHEQYGPEAMTHAIQGGMLALEAANKLSGPLIAGVSRLTESDKREEALQALRDSDKQRQEAAGMEPRRRDGAEVAPQDNAPNEPKYMPGGNPDIKGWEKLRGSFPGLAAHPESPEVNGIGMDARVAAAKAAMGRPANPEDMRDFQRASGERSLSQGERTVARAEAGAGGNMPGESREEYMRRAAASMAMGMPLPPFQEAKPASMSKTLLPEGATVKPMGEAVAPVAATPQTALAAPEAIKTTQGATLESPWSKARAEAVDKAKKGLSLTELEKSHATGIYNYDQLMQMAAEANFGRDVNAKKEVMALFGKLNENGNLGIHPESIADLMTGSHIDRARQGLVNAMTSKQAGKTPLEEQLIAERILQLQADNPVAAAAAKAKADKAAADAKTAEEVAANAPVAQKGKAQQEEAKGINAGELQSGLAAQASAKGFTETERAVHAGDLFTAQADKALEEARNAPHYNRLRNALLASQRKNTDARTLLTEVNTTVAKIESETRRALNQAKTHFYNNAQANNDPNSPGKQIQIFGPSLAAWRGLDEEAQRLNAVANATKPEDAGYKTGQELDKAKAEAAAKLPGILAARGNIVKSLRSSGYKHWVNEAGKETDIPSLPTAAPTTPANPNEAD